MTFRNLIQCLAPGLILGAVAVAASAADIALQHTLPCSERANYFEQICKTKKLKKKKKKNLQGAQGILVPLLICACPQ